MADVKLAEVPWLYTNDVADVKLGEVLFDRITRLYTTFSSRPIFSIAGHHRQLSTDVVLSY